MSTLKTDRKLGCTSRSNFKNRKDWEKEVEKWREVARPLENKLNLTLGGFDPGFVFYENNATYRRGIELPKEIVIKLSEILKEEIE